MKVLIAEDDDEQSLNLERFVERQGHEPTVCGSGSEALSKFKNGEYPLVLSDWMMPGLTGPQLCETIRALAPLQYQPRNTDDTHREAEAEPVIGAGRIGLLDQVPDVRAELVRGHVLHRLAAEHARFAELALVVDDANIADGGCGVRVRCGVEIAIGVDGETFRLPANAARDSL